MLIWPFIFITIALTAVLGYAISQIEKSKVMNNWPAYRCSPAVMFTAGMFKPASDPRTPSTFASDNFQFCMKELAEKVMSSVMEPLETVFSGHGYLAKMVTEGINSVREVLAKIYNEFLGFLDEFYRRYGLVSQQLLNTTAHLRSAFQRVNAVVLSTVFIGLSMFRGILNSVDFVIKIVLVILGIMVALMIVLFFVLFPFFPLIFSVISVITAFAVGSVAAEAANLRGGFCVPGHTLVQIPGQQRPIPISEIEPDSDPDGPITAVMEFAGDGVQMYEIDGIVVSGAHLVQKEGADGWHHVREDPRANAVSTTYDRIYCLNTKNHIITVVHPFTGKTLALRDWEEIEEDDRKTQLRWCIEVLKYLNRGQLFEKYLKWISTVHSDNSNALISADTHIMIENHKSIPISTVQIGDRVLDENGESTEVLGIVKGYGWFDGDLRTQNIFVKHATEGYWYRENVGNSGSGTAKTLGYNLITASGTFRTSTAIVRDFSEVGMDYLATFNRLVEETL